MNNKYGLLQKEELVKDNNKYSKYNILNNCLNNNEKSIINKNTELTSVINNKYSKSDKKQTESSYLINSLLNNLAIVKCLKEKRVKCSLHLIKPIGNWKPNSMYIKSLNSCYNKDNNIILLDEIRNLLNIKISGEQTDKVPIIDSFESMRLPKELIKSLNKLNITIPTSVQMQGIPAILTGRDLVLISPSGTGKSLVFIIPSLIVSIYQEIQNSIENRTSFKGPFAVIVAPNRELAIQINNIINEIIKNLLILFSKSSNKKNSILIKSYNLYKNTSEFNIPIIKSTLCIGGIDSFHQISELSKGVHIVIGTPGRLSDLIYKKKLILRNVKLLVFDEADKLFDPGFDEEIKKMFDGYNYINSQVLLFSSTMPKIIQKFASECLNKTVVVSMSKFKKSNLKYNANFLKSNKLDNNITQDIEFIKEELRLLNIIETLKKSPPPVLIFCESKNDVDQIHEYLLLKGLNVCAIHGDKEQYERNLALREIKEGIKDILVCTDIVSKGVDFQGIEHIINYEMPKEIETYILRLGRLGRVAGDVEGGLITTYITKNADEAILLDLKHLLIEYNQIIPNWLDMVRGDNTDVNNKECDFCGGFGHKLEQCHKFEIQNIKRQTNNILKSAYI